MTPPVPASVRPPVPGPELDEMIDGQEASWDPLRGARILLTGGTGFMGTWLLELFCRARRRLDLDARIWVLTRDPAAFRSRSPHLAEAPGITLCPGDVRDFPALQVPLTHVIHGATASHGPLAEGDPLEHLDTIVGGTRRVLEEAAASGARRLLLLSSGAVYGRQPPDLAELPETFPGGPDPLDPGTTYAQGKRMAEHLCVRFARRGGLEVVVARGFAFVGPHLPLDAHFAIGNFIRDLLRGGAIRVNGDGTPLRSYLYASEMAAWTWRLLLEGRPGCAYNLGSDQALSIGDLAGRLGRWYGVPVQIAREAPPGRPAERYIPSLARVRGELGLSPRVGLAEAVRRTLDWHALCN